MSDLEDVFGEDFAQHVREKTAERRQERNRVSDEQLVAIAQLAINEGKFEEGDPQFQYTTENGITHDVLLMQLPDPDNSEVWQHLEEPWEGAARIPLEYLGEWYWSTFPNKKDLAKLDQGDYTIVVGSVEENEGDDGSIYKNIYPVRGLITLDEAQELAENYEPDSDFDEESDDMDFAEPDEEEEDTEEDEEKDDDSSSGELTFDSSSSSSSSGGLSNLVGDNEEEEDEEEEEEAVPYEEIAGKVEELAEAQDDNEEPQVYEIEEGTPEHKKFTEIVCNNIGLEVSDAAADVVIDVIDEHREDEEEDDDDMNKLF